MLFLQIMYCNDNLSQFPGQEMRFSLIVRRLMETGMLIETEMINKHWKY